LLEDRSDTIFGTFTHFQTINYRIKMWSINLCSCCF